MSRSLSLRRFGTAGATVAEPHHAPEAQTSDVAWGRPYVLVLVCLLLLGFGYYIWSGATSVPLTFNAPNGDIYNQLTTSFLHGHLYLPERPPAGLLKLKDPYDPAQNGLYASKFHDLSLYKGHFYASWGPTPVLTLFAPFRITGLVMSQTFAIALYVFVGLVCAVALMHAVVRRLLPATPRWLLLLATFGLITMNVGAFLLRRPAQYEVAISSGYCFEMAGLALLLTAVLGPRVRRGRMAWGSLCLGLAMGARNDLVLGGVAALVVGIWCIRRRGESWRILLWALVPAAVCGILLLAYNAVRFGQLTNFGEPYTLSGIEQLHAPFYKLKWILPGIFSYLYVPARLALTFPHAFLMTAAQDPFSLPRGYEGGPGAAGAEPAGGLLATAPITLLLFVLPLLWWRHRSRERRPLVVATGLTVLGVAIIVVLSWGIFGTTERYEVDFATLLVLPAYLLWAMFLVRWPRRTFGRYLTATIAVLLTAFGAFVGLAIGITGYYDPLHTEHPSTFAALEDATGPFQTLATIIAGSPQIARVYSTTEPVSLPSVDYHTLTYDNASAWLGSGVTTVTIVSPRSEHAALVAVDAVAAGVPAASASYVHVAVKGRPTDTVPILGASLRMPVSLHTGINRVDLTLAGKAVSTSEVLLSGVQVESAG